MESNSTQPGRSFLIIAIVAVLWNALGVMAYLMDVMMSDEALSALPAAEQALYANVPAWATGAYAIAVFAGLLGSVGLILKKKWAVPFFLASVVGVLVQMFHALFMTETIEILGAASAIMPVVILVVAGLLVWYSRSCVEKGWLS